MGYRLDSFVGTVRQLARRLCDPDCRVIWEVWNVQGTVCYGESCDFSEAELLAASVQVMKPNELIVMRLV